jgi:glutathione S-transferase
MLLYATKGSLYSAKVRIALKAKGLEWAEADPPGGYRSEAYRGIVARGTVPALQVQEGLIVDSEAIIEYIEEAFPFPPLLPRDRFARARIRSLSRFHDTVLEPALRMLFPLVRKSDESVRQRADVLNRHLGVLGQIADASPLLGGDTLSLADCSYPPTFVAMEIVAKRLGFTVDWPEKIVHYRAALEALPIIRDVLDPYLAATERWATAE